VVRLSARYFSGRFAPEIPDEDGICGQEDRSAPSRGLPGRCVNVHPEPGSTPGCEALRNLWRDRRASIGHRRHPRQWPLWYEIRARPRVGDDGLSQIGSAVMAESAAIADLGPELLGRVSSLALPAQSHRMIRTQSEEQRSESNEYQHDARIVVLEARPCQVGQRNSSVERVDSGG
jgi:hypothetical protein